MEIRTLADYFSMMKEAEKASASAGTAVKAESAKCADGASDAAVVKTMSTIFVDAADKQLASAVLPSYKAMSSRRHPGEVHLYVPLPGDAVMATKANVAALQAAGVRVIRAHTADRSSGTEWSYSHDRGWQSAAIAE